MLRKPPDRFYNRFYPPLLDEDIFVFLILALIVVWVTFR